ncbi:MAG: HipA domain-containing protein [Candidatus Omnitrophota bacterium]
MNHCFLCGKDTKGENNYHGPCLKGLFGVNYCPKIDFALNEVSAKAQEMAGKLSMSGVQAKLSMKLNQTSKKLEITADNGEYILKPRTDTFPNIPQNENLCMNIASSLEIAVPSHSLIRLKDNSLAYIVKRFDRVKGKKLHQEDFSQILEEKDKYKGSLEEIGHKLREISEVPGLDLQLFFERILLFFIIGNGDAHLKNFSIIYDEEEYIRLSPAYDIVSSKLVIPGEEDLALSMNGKKNKITGKDFEQFAKTLKIHSTVSYKKILGKIEVINSLIKEDTFLTEKERAGLQGIVRDRASRFSIA